MTRLMHLQSLRFGRHGDAVRKLRGEPPSRGLVVVLKCVHKLFETLPLQKLKTNFPPLEYELNSTTLLNQEYSRGDTLLLRLDGLSMVVVSLLLLCRGLLAMSSEHSDGPTEGPRGKDLRLLPTAM